MRSGLILLKVRIFFESLELYEMNQARQNFLFNPHFNRLCRIWEKVRVLGFLQKYYTKLAFFHSEHTENY